VTLVMLGYALAASSCEEADSVDACTVTALDAITAFAVPNPNCSSRKQSVFSCLVALQVALLSGSLSLLRTDKFLFRQSFQPSTEIKLKICFTGSSWVSPSITARYFSSRPSDSTSGWPSRPGEFHPEPLTEPDVNLSAYPARATR
jgi:hypothetical protein